MYWNISPPPRQFTHREKITQDKLKKGRIKGRKTEIQIQFFKNTRGLYFSLKMVPLSYIFPFRDTSMFTPHAAFFPFPPLPFSIKFTFELYVISPVYFILFQLLTPTLYFSSTFIYYGRN
jgi:hypothetical protein